MAVSKAVRSLRPVDLGRAIGLSAEMARRYEKWGYLPPAERSATGRRLYSQRHLHAILAAREMRDGFGWKAALKFDAIAAVLEELGGGRPSTALTAVERRRHELAQASERCSRATAAFWSYAAEAFDRPVSLTDTLAKQRTVP